MKPVLILAIVGLCSGTDEPWSNVDIYHTWDTGFEGSFYINPPTDIHEWVVHITFDKPVDDVEIWVCEELFFNGTDFVCQSKIWNGDIHQGDFYQIQFMGHYNESTRLIATSPTYFVEGIFATMGTPPTTSVITKTTQGQTTTINTLKPTTTTDSPTTITDFSTANATVISDATNEMDVTSTITPPEHRTTITEEPTITQTIQTDYTTKVTVCNPNPCQFGTCSPYKTTYRCTCDKGASGRHCDIVSDPCQFLPCIHGNCTAHPEIDISNFTCSCNFGYSGLLCNTAEDACLSNPCIYGLCVSDGPDYFCHCDPFYTGQDCDFAIDHCQSSPCEAGTCINHLDSFQCECPAGRFGVRCELIK